MTDLTNDEIDGEIAPAYFHGRKWDAPATDGAIRMDPAFAEAILGNARAPQLCDLCEERLTQDDDVLISLYMKSHVECLIRSILGDVQHLEGRCGYCDNTEPRPQPGDEHDTYREGAKATLQWLIEHNQGRFHD